MARGTEKRSLMETKSLADCLTCYGKGEIVDDFGPSRCPDCGGAGKQALALYRRVPQAEIP